MAFCWFWPVFSRIRCCLPAFSASGFSFSFSASSGLVCVFSCCCPDCSCFFSRRQDCAHLRRAWRSDSQECSVPKAPQKKRIGKDCMSMSTIHHHPTLPPGETAGAQSPLIKWQFTRRKTPSFWDGHSIRHSPGQCVPDGSQQKSNKHIG